MRRAIFVNTCHKSRWVENYWYGLDLLVPFLLFSPLEQVSRMKLLLLCLSVMEKEKHF
ncbi:hypothetical protein HanIR_Chr13g0664711 [Helianthus annuus]|nr:hypothetical protein HanIR_Chr13g0664711 [Helianthus annuus]